MSGRVSGSGFLGVGLFVSIVMAVVASILFLGLLMMKVVLAVSTVLVFVGMPIAIVLSPVVPWISRALVRAFAVCLAVPLVWAVCFAASGAMLNDGLFLKGSSGFFDALLEPLAAIALLWMMLLLPSRLAQMAMLGAGAVRGGFVSRAVSYAAGSQIRDATRQYLPGLAGGGHGGSDQRARATDSRLGARLSAESVLAASTIQVTYGSLAEMTDAFERAYLTRFSFLMPDKPVVVEAVSVEAAVASAPAGLPPALRRPPGRSAPSPVPFPAAWKCRRCCYSGTDGPSTPSAGEGGVPEAAEMVRMFAAGGWATVPLYRRTPCHPGRPSMAPRSLPRTWPRPWLSPAGAPR